MSSPPTLMNTSTVVIFGIFAPLGDFAGVWILACEIARVSRHELLTADIYLRVTFLVSMNAIERCTVTGKV